MLSKQEFHISITTDSNTALDWLAEASEFSRQRVKQLMQQGCVWLEQNEKHTFVQRLRRAKKILKTGDTLHLYFDEDVLDMQPEAAMLVSDEGDYSIWNKPSGMLSQGSKWGDHCTIYRWAEKHLKPERTAFIVHRLDRAANGLIILAHKKRVAAQFAKMFERGEIEKYYRVTVDGDFSIATTADQITIDEEVGGKSAISHARLLNYDHEQNESTLEVKIDTGRKHQIRKHLSGLGYPVVGDRLYGSGNNNKNLQLSAIRLKFVCPVTAVDKSYQLGGS